ncbi:MAG TPA: 16S rRNA (cytosine(967)-C(5))-methyltransferase RsmB [Candidatus Dormibacteraeota bacterium]|nr:16S rRNA (cytosine(967)-C(5))-methyltransferase RsmB [Candidatus Dormibacteraeota bacterium]
MSGQKPREIAVQILQAREKGGFVENLLENALARTRLSPQDRGLCQELVYGVVRWQATLDWLITRKTDARPKKPVLQDILRLGLYQLFWLDRIPNHAAVHETVELAKAYRLSGQAGFINAVLRGYLRESDATRQSLRELKLSQPELGYSHPEWLQKRWQSRWGAEKTTALLEWNNSPPKTFARINTLKADPGKLLAQWREENVEYDFVRHDWFEENLIFELKSHPPLATLPSFIQGLFYVQDPSTLLAVQMLAPERGETILDLCAAPGGKLTYAAQLLANGGRIVAHDTAPDRLNLIEENCKRLGVTCVQAILPAALHPAHLHSKDAPAISAVPKTFDRILLDAPCSNTGVMRRRVDLRWRIREEEISRLRSIQRDLLEKAGRLLKPGGTLVYSTCSLEPEENADLVAEFISHYPQFKLKEQRELLPFSDGVDGAYVARFLL